MADDPSDGKLLETPLAAAHLSAGARMVPFAGYAMPVQYPDGIIAEHLWTRSHAGLFDVSHMGQARLTGPDFATAAAALEHLVPADIAGLRPGQQRYTQLLNEEGGIVDDLMVVRPLEPQSPGEILIIVNAATKEADYRLIEASLPDKVLLQRLDRLALIALQGPSAVSVLSALAPAAADMTFMSARRLTVAGIEVHASRSGYTGEDGYEISVPTGEAGQLWETLLADQRAMPIGLGARDSLRLEAGLALHRPHNNHGPPPAAARHPPELQNRRRDEGGFPGRLRITRELAEGPIRRRVGIKVEGRAPVREHAGILDKDGELVGKVTSGGFAPSVGGPIAMGYVVSEFAKPGTALGLELRGRRVAGTVVPLPFTPHRYKR